MEKGIETIDDLYKQASELGEKVNEKFGVGTAWNLYQKKVEEFLRFHRMEVMRNVIADLEEKLKGE